MDNTTPQVGQHWRLRFRDSFGFVSYSDAVISSVSADGLYVTYRENGFPVPPVTTKTLQSVGVYQKPSWFWRLFGYT